MGLSEYPLNTALRPMQSSERANYVIADEKILGAQYCPEYLMLNNNYVKVVICLRLDLFKELRRRPRTGERSSYSLRNTEAIKPIFRQ